MALLLFTNSSSEYISKKIEILYDMKEKKNSIIYTKTKIKINDDFFYYLADKGDQLCMYSKSPCTSLLAEKSLKYSSKKNYSFLTVK